MRKLLISLCAAISLAGSLSAQTTAVNFNCNDCAGNNHDLFSELDAGKVVVIAWVMPCATCVGPTLTASNIVQSYAASYPGRVLMYIVDDVANTNCTTLNAWINSNGIAGTTFSNTAIDMNDYGSPGMPKIVVLGGTSHQVFFNQNGTAAGNVNGIQTAINSALTTSVQSPPAENFGATLLTNPVNSGSIKIRITGAAGTELSVGITDLAGRKTETTFSEQKNAGETIIDMPSTGLAEGLYFIRVSNGLHTEILKLVITH